MRRMGKIVWIFFYIAFLPLICLRYTSIAIGGVVKGLVEDYTDPKPDLLSIFSTAGYYLFGALFWPVLYVLVLAFSILYRMYAYVVMVASLCAYKSHN